MNKATKQTILSTIFSYLGVALGAFYTIFIIPKLFNQHPENYGSLLFLMNYVGIFLILSSLATPLSIIKFYPLYHRKRREQILSFLLWINTIGLALSFGIFYYYSQTHPIVLNIEGKQVDISFFFYPMLISTTLFSYFESYCHALLKIAAPAFLNTTFTRLWLFLILLLYYYDAITFHTFTYLYFAQFVISFFLLVAFVWKYKQDNFFKKPHIPENYKEIIRYSLFALPATSAAVLIVKIDVQMIGNFLGEAQIAYYNYAIFFMTVLLIPKNMLMQTSRSIISRDFQKQALHDFIPKYTKISFAFLLSTLVVFIAIVINIEELMAILGSKFGSNEVKYAIFILGVGRVIEASLASNHAVLEYSKYYKMILVFETTTLIVLVVLNLIFIPLFGIVGAAISSALVFVLNAISKSIFVYRKLGLLAIKQQQLKVVFVITSLLLLYFVPLEIFKFLTNEIFNEIMALLVRSLLFFICLAVVTRHFNLKQIYFTKHSATGKDSL